MHAFVHAQLKKLYNLVCVWYKIICIHLLRMSWMIINLVIYHEPVTVSEVKGVTCN